MQPKHKSTYAWRARIGLIVPLTNTTNEAEWSRVMPEGVTFHTTRMPFHESHDTDEGRRALVRSIAGKAAELVPARVDVVAYACTAGSMVNPRHYLAQEVEASTGTPLVTTAAAIVDALEALGTKRVSVATPYHDALNAQERDFLAANGIETLRIKGLGYGANGPSDFPRIAETPMAAIEAHVKSCFIAGSEALLITCTDFPTQLLHAKLEAELGVPVVTSNQATLWAALKRAGIPDEIAPLGALFKGR